MEYRRVGSSGLMASAIGLGGNTFGDTAAGDEAIAVIRRALELGVTFIDTADVYANGLSEELIGAAVAGRRAGVILATKVGWRVTEGPPVGPLSRRWIVRAAERSLRRLKTDYIDLYQAHRADPETPLEETLRAMDDLVHQGKVRYVGCSNLAAWQMVHGLGISERAGLARWISVQAPWNLLDGLNDPQLVPACRAFGVTIIPYWPLASGMLTGKYRRGEEPPAGTRLGDVSLVRYLLTDAKLAAAERLRPWAEARGHTLAELAIAWLRGQPQVATVIVGARTPRQVEMNVAAANWTLSPAERDEVEQLARGRSPESHA